ncbi:MAG TPA: histidine kinase [Pilimelia sp.]|nr:histidine kinase [Pilimelia sp.]
MQRIQATVRRHPRWADGGLAVLLVLVNAPALASAGVGVIDWLWFGAAHLPLVWRRRAPVLVFWTVLGLAGAAVITSPRAIIQGVYPESLALVAAYTVARYRPRRYLWPAIAVLETILVVAAWQQDQRWTSLALGTSALAATVLLGMTVSTRRAYLAELEDRARRLERERDQQAQLAVATERARIAREMHDIVAHNLAVMIALADGAAFTAAAAPDRAADAMQQVSGTGRQALAEMRRLLGLLRDSQPPQAPSELAPQPGLDDIDELIDQVRGTGVQVTLTREGVAGAWGPGAGLAVYRIVQEALTNTLKHAGPQARAQVRLRATAAGVDVEVTDDGAGRPAAATAGGHGLAGMIERAASYGGQVQAGPCRGTGWRVRARLHFDDREGVG